MTTEQPQVSKSASACYGRNFNCMYTTKVDSSGKNEYYALIFQGTTPNPHSLEIFLLFLSEGGGTSGHPSEPETSYNVDPFKISKALGSDVQDIPDIYTGEQARRIVENLERLK